MLELPYLVYNVAYPDDGDLLLGAFKRQDHADCFCRAFLYLPNDTVVKNKGGKYQLASKEYSDTLVIKLNGEVVE